MKRFLTLGVLLMVAGLAFGQIIVDTAITVPVNTMPLVDQATGVVVDEGVTYDETGMNLTWNFVTEAGVASATTVTPTTAGVYDWAHLADGMYSLEIPASGGGTINNAEEGFGWFSGDTTANLPWAGPRIWFSTVNVVNSLIAGSDTLDVAATSLGANVVTAAAIANAAIDNATFAADVGSTAYATNIIALAADKAGLNGVNTIQISGDATAANNAELFFDGTGYAGGTINLQVDSVLVAGGIPITAANITDDWESQSQSDPTGFHVNVLEVAGTGQTANDNGADINAILVDTGTDGVLVSATGVTAVAAGVGTYVVEDAITLEQAIRLIVSLAAGKSDGGGTTTLHYRDQGDSVNRLTFTVDANGNRTASTINVTD